MHNTTFVVSSLTHACTHTVVCFVSLYVLEYVYKNFMTQEVILQEPEHKTHIYKLIGVVVHHKLSKNSGHYVSYFRSRCDTTQWFYGNDDQVC